MQARTAGAIVLGAQRRAAQGASEQAILHRSIPRKWRTRPGEESRHEQLAWGSTLRRPETTPIAQLVNTPSRPSTKPAYLQLPQPFTDQGRSLIQWDGECRVQGRKPVQQGRPQSTTGSKRRESGTPRNRPRQPLAKFPTHTAGSLSTWPRARSTAAPLQADPAPARCPGSAHRPVREAVSVSASAGFGVSTTRDCRFMGYCQHPVNRFDRCVVSAPPANHLPLAAPQPRSGPETMRRGRGAHGRKAVRFCPAWGVLGRSGERHTCAPSGVL